MLHDVFISHASQDKAVADSACAALEAAGIRCWIAPRDVQPGRSFAGEITRAIQGSSVFVLIFSAHSNTSEQVLREVQLAVNSHLHIIQFRIEEVNANDDLKYYLSTPHWLDAMNPPLKRHLSRLVDAIQVLVSGRTNSEVASSSRPDVAPDIAVAAMAAPSVPRDTLPSRKSSLIVTAVLTSAVVAASLSAIAVWHLSNRVRPDRALESSRNQASSPVESATPSPVSSPAPTAASPAEPAAAAIVTDSKDAELYFQRGHSRYQKSDFLGALEDYNRALQLDPANALGYLRRGVVKHEQGDFNGALADYKRTLQLEPDNAVAHNNVASVDRDQGKFEAALVEYDRALELDPRAAPIYANRGLLRLLQGDAHSAQVEYNKGLELDPRNARSLESLAGFYLQTRRWTEATETLHKAIAADSTRGFYHLTLLWIAQCGSEGEATADRELADAMSKRNPPKTEDWYGRIADFLRGKVSVAQLTDPKSSFLTADKRKKGQAWYFVGKRRLASRDQTGAVFSFQEATAVQLPGVLEYRLALAELKQIGK